MKEQVNPILRLGCILLLAGGVVSGALNLLGTLVSLGSMSLLSDSTYGYLESQIRDASDGLLGADAALGFLNGLFAALITVFVVMLVIDVVVGILGLRRAGRPEKYGFFLVWGVILLVIGLLGALFSGISSLSGVAALACGVAAPILFLVGASQQKKLLRDSQPVQQ